MEVKESISVISNHLLIVMLILNGSESSLSRVNQRYLLTSLLILNGSESECERLFDLLASLEKTKLILNGSESYNYLRR